MTRSTPSRLPATLPCVGPRLRAVGVRRARTTAVGVTHARTTAAHGPASLLGSGGEPFLASAAELASPGSPVADRALRSMGG